MSELKYVSFSKLKAGDNSRRFFDEGKLGELKESIRIHGVRTPLEGMMNEETLTVTLIAGERRLRALGLLLADLGWLDGDDEPEGEARLFFRVPVMIVPPSDVERARELNLIENLQREGLTPVEEADGYADLLERVNPDTGKAYTIAEVAVRLSKERGYVNRLLRLRQAPECILEAVMKEKVSVSAAVAVGSIFDVTLRERCAKQVLFPDSQKVALNYVQTVELIRREYMMNLNAAPFDKRDADLVPVVLLAGSGERVKGGACADCPRRSGNMLGLETEVKGGDSVVGVDENLCTSPGCYREKCAADWNARKSAKLAEIRAGVEKGGNGEGEASKRVGALAARLIVEGERASRVFGGPGGSVAYDSALRKAGDRPGVDLAVNVSPGEEPLTWRELAANAGLPLVLALNPHSGRGEEMVEWAAVVEKTRGNARAGGFKSVFCRVGVEAEREQEREQEQEKEREQEQEGEQEQEREQEQESGAESRANATVGRAIARESRAVIFEELEMLGGERLAALSEPTLWRTVFELLVSRLDAAPVFADWRGWSNDECVERVAELCGESVQRWQAWSVMALVARQVGSSGFYAPSLETLFPAVGVDAEWLEKVAYKRGELRAKGEGASEPVKPEKRGWSFRAPEDFRCDVCGVDLVVPAGSMDEAARAPAMKCAAHGGKWDAENVGQGGAVDTPNLRELLAAEAAAEPVAVTFETQVQMRMEGKAWEEIIGPRPAPGSPEFKAREALRVKIFKAATKATKEAEAAARGASVKKAKKGKA
jgi:ParB-like chromosome segregation protein Spo0J